MLHRAHIVHFQRLNGVVSRRRLVAYHQHRGVSGGLEDRQIAKIDHRLQRDIGAQQVPQRLAITSPHELVGADVDQRAILAQLPQALRVEVDVDVRDAVVNIGVDLFQV